VTWTRRFTEGSGRELTGAAAALLVAITASVVITWPMLPNHDQIVLGGGELGGWLWRYNWHFVSLDGVLDTDQSLGRKWLEFVSLGRYPETGNIMDVLAISYPLQHLLGFPSGYNLKILLILVLNGLSAYALGRYFSGSVSASLAAVPLAVINPLCLQEIQACGLRQAVLWWVLLYPPLLDRALRRRTLGAGVLAGLCFGIAAAWYWFYGLFTGIFTIIWVVKHVVSEGKRTNLAGVVRAGAGVGLGLVLSAGPFILPYALPPEGQQAGGAAQLPEMSFFVPFPPYDTVSQAPLRPQTYAENVLASIHRTIGSSWSATYPFDPSLNEGLQIVVLIFGVLPAVWRPRSWGWLAVWVFFYLGTLGPYLRIGVGDAQEVTRFFTDYVVRMPFAWMFTYIPGMSRMFAPYRLAAFVVVASVALLAIGLSRFRHRVWIAPLVMVAIAVQPMGRWGRGSVNEGDADSRELRSPLKVNKIKVPQYYQDLDPTQLTGIIEIPFDQQQDLLYYYQIVHGQKVYRSWASPAAVPPSLRPEAAGGDAGQRLRYLARGDTVTGPIADTLAALSHIPDTADLSPLSTSAFPKFAKTNNYQRLIIHERGYYLVDPARGDELYKVAVRRAAEALGQEPEIHEELRKGDPANPELGVPIVGDLVPWSSQPADLPAQRAPAVYHMAVFQIPAWDGTEPPAASPPAGGGPTPAGDAPPEPGPGATTPPPPAGAPGPTPAPPGAPGGGTPS